MLTEDEVREVRDRRIVRANELIRKSRFSLSLQQQKIILYIISSIKPDDVDFTELEFDIRDFCQVSGINPKSGRYYAEVKRSIKDIADKSLWVTLADGRETLLRWIEKPYIDPGSGTIRLKMDNDMKPFLLQLQNNFTQTQLLYSLHFRSKYSIRLYDFICSLHYNTLDTYISRRYELNEVRQLLGVPSDAYPEYKDFKKFALRPALDEVNKYSDKNVSILEVRRGRFIAFIEFEISGKDPVETLTTAAQVERELDSKKEDNS